mgnify:CR=1 FL=1
MVGLQGRRCHFLCLRGGTGLERDSKGEVRLSEKGKEQRAVQSKVALTGNG